MATVAEQQTLEERIAEAVADWEPREWSPDWRPLRVPMTFDEFLDVATLPHNRFEYVDGEAVEMPGVELEHALLNGWLFTLLNPWVMRRNLGTLLPPSYTQPTKGRKRGREPDTLFVLKAHASRLGDKCVEGAADLVIEIVSPGSRTTDRRTKFREYARVGITEYWVLDPTRKLAEFFMLDEGSYEPAEGEEDVYHSRVLAGVFIDPRWLWDMPPVDEIIARWDAAAQRT